VARRVLAAVLLAVATGAAAEESLGTLFLSAEERARLDALRRGDAPAATGAAAPRDHALTGFVQRAELPESRGRNLGVIISTLLLNLPGAFHPIAHLCRGRPITLVAEFFVRHGRHFDVQVDAIE